MATGYKVNGVDISELAMQDYGSTQCPTISLGVTGFSTKIGRASCRERV